MLTHSLTQACTVEVATGCERGEGADETKQSEALVQRRVEEGGHARTGTDTSLEATAPGKTSLLRDNPPVTDSINLRFTAIAQDAALNEMYKGSASSFLLDTM